MATFYRNLFQSEEQTAQNVKDNFKYIANDHTATDGERIIVDTVTKAVLLSLPLQPIVGATIYVSPAKNTYSVNNLTIRSTDERIQGTTQDIVVNVDGLGLKLIYAGSQSGWLLYYADSLFGGDIKPLILGGTGSTSGAQQPSTNFPQVAAWCHFTLDQAGTIDIATSFNVATVESTVAGEYTINWIQELSQKAVPSGTGTDYFVTGSATALSSATAPEALVYVKTITQNSATIKIFNSNGETELPAHVTVAAIYGP